MKLNSVNAQQGYIWIRQGIWLFKQNPLGFLMLVFLYIFLVQLAILIPIVGVFAILLITPSLQFGFMTGCRQTIQKIRLSPLVYLVGLRSSGALIRKRLLQLGLIHTSLILVLSFIASFFVDVQVLLPALTGDKPLGIEIIKQMYIVLGIVVALYIPIGMLMWFSPILVGWEDMPVTQALFSSWIACWRNRSAFIIYLCIWGALLVAVPLLLSTMFEALNLSEVGSFVIAPISMACMTVLYCSAFATWKNCFSDNVATTNPDEIGA